LAASIAGICEKESVSGERTVKNSPLSYCAMGGVAPPNTGIILILKIFSTIAVWNGLPDILVERVSDF
jgi:hypothetical protein